LLVDTEGFVLKAKVTSAKVMDYEGTKKLLRDAGEKFPRLKHLWLNAGYTAPCSDVAPPLVDDTR
jgi:NAD(P)-dependent dehydrogenase (short-subunit alcohol dehydrogenase family)